MNRKQADELQAVIESARKLAGSNPDRFGGRYIAFRDGPRKVGPDGKTFYGERYPVIMEPDADENGIPPDMDLLAHVTPKRVAGMGRLRCIFDEDGKIRHEFITPPPEVCDDSAYVRGPVR